MAIFYRCDRCNEEQNTRLSIMTVPRIYKDERYQKEICHNCLRALETWLKEGRQKK